MQIWLGRTTPLLRALHGFFGSIILSNIFFNYFLCIVTHPGSTSSVSNQALQQSVPSTLKWCQRCQKTKPPLSHHCTICKQCVLSMDHHCPWVNTCVGHYNYRFFYLFLFWLEIGCCYSVRYVLFPKLNNLFFWLL